MLKPTKPNSSEWNAHRQLCLSQKKVRSVHFCADYCWLNAVILHIKYPIPRMNECIELLDKAQIFSTLYANLKYY